jgi:hypothetical protein
MPFKSKSQARACYALLRRNPKSKWNCAEWSKETDWKHLPERMNVKPKSIRKNISKKKKSIKKNTRKLSTKRK